MVDEEVLEHIIDIARHGGIENAQGPIPAPQIGGNFVLDQSVIDGKSDSFACLARCLSL